MKKTNKIRSHISLGLGFAAIAAILALMPTAVSAQQHKKGAEYQMEGITRQSEAEALKPGDAIAMACAKCKSVMVHNVTTEKGHIKVMTVGEKHLCPGCKSTITVVGAGKGAKDQVKHVCEKCGEDSVYCCATKPGAGATKGMEKKE